MSAQVVHNSRMVIRRSGDQGFRFWGLAGAAPGLLRIKENQALSVMSSVLIAGSSTINPRAIFPSLGRSVRFVPRFDLGIISRTGRSLQSVSSSKKGNARYLLQRQFSEMSLSMICYGQ